MKAPFLFIPYHPSPADIVYYDRLPHRSRAGRTVFVTWRLSDSLPPAADVEKSILQAQRRWLSREKLNFCPLSQNVEEILCKQDPVKALAYRMVSFWVNETFTEKKLGGCALRSLGSIRAVRNAILEEMKWDCGIGDFVICYNHVHLLLVPGADGEIQEHLKRIKGRASRYLGKAFIAELPQPIWQRSWFDHVVRNRNKLDRIRDYIASHRVPFREAYYAVEWT